MAPSQPPNNKEYPDSAAFFEQMMSGFDPNRSRAPGRGVDHNDASADNSFPTFWPGFPFNRPPPPPAPPGPPGNDAPRPPSPPTPPGPDHPHGRHRHPHSAPGHHHPPPPPGAWGWGNAPGANWYMDDGDFYFSDGRHRHDRHDRRHGREDGTRENPAGVSDDEKAKTSSDEKKKDDSSNNEKNGSPDTMRAEEDVPDPDEMVPEYEEAETNRTRSGPEFVGGFGGFGHGWGGRRGRGGFGGRGGCRGGGGRRHRHDERPGCPFNAAPGAGAANDSAPFSFPDMMRGLMNHPFVQHMGAAARSYNGNNNNDTTENNDDVDSFSPPVDIFNTPRAYVLHVALPGAKREDVGVNWDPEHSTLSISGVIHRAGDEEFLSTLLSSERRVGVFEKKVVLPPRELETEQQSREEIDVDGIAAKLDDGVLVIMVPKVEKEWTEVRKVDIL